MTISKTFRSTHERFDTATYAKTQRRLKLNTLSSIDFNFNFNVDVNQNLDLDDSNSNFIFVSFMFTLFLMRITSTVTRITSAVMRIISADKKLFDDKKISQKMYKCNKKRKIIYSINQFYDSLYDNLRKKSYLLTRDQIKFFERSKFFNELRIFLCLVYRFTE
jgi:hypothetical protein